MMAKVPANRPVVIELGDKPFKEDCIYLVNVITI
jgi:hypothetical protein